MSCPWLQVSKFDVGWRGLVLICGVLPLWSLFCILFVFFVWQCVIRRKKGGKNVAVVPLPSYLVFGDHEVSIQITHIYTKLPFLEIHKLLSVCMRPAF